MILSRSREFLVKMGDYETYKFGAFVSLSHHDFGFTDAEWAALDAKKRKRYADRLREEVLAELEAQLLGEIEDSAELTRHKKSFLKRALTGRK